jgi:hypothetical protein
MFILEILLGLKSMQGDVTCAFLHADLEENETVYVDMPMGFAQYGKNGKKQCLKLKKTLYGLRQSPRAFWKYITVKLEQCGLEQSKFDPYLFIGPEVICVVYVDGLIFWSKDVPLINGFAMKLCELGVDLEQEDDAAGFLGVTLDRDGPSGLLEIKQIMQMGKELMVGLATTALLECYYIYLAILNLILPMLSIVALGICSARSTHMSWL